MSLQVVATGPCSIASDEHARIHVIAPTLDALQQNMLKIQGADVVVLVDRDGFLFDLPENIWELTVFMMSIGLIDCGVISPEPLPQGLQPEKEKDRVLDRLVRAMVSTPLPTDATPTQVAVAILQLLNQSESIGEKIPYDLDPKSEEYEETTRLIERASAKMIAQLFAGGHGAKEQEVLLLANPRTEFASAVLDRLLMRFGSSILGRRTRGEPVESEAELHPVFAKLGRSLPVRPDFAFFTDPLPWPSSLLGYTLGPGLKCRKITDSDGVQVGFEAKANKLTMAFIGGLSRSSYPTDTVDTLVRSLLQHRAPPAPPAVVIPFPIQAPTAEPGGVSPHRRFNWSLDELRKAKAAVEKILNGANPMIGESAALLTIYPGVLRALRETKYNVLVYGQIGSGKEVLLELLKRGDQRQGRFIIHAFSESTDELIQSDLFGHVKGAFTGATENKRGFVEEVGGGTLALDNAQNITQQAQAALLRVLEPSRSFRPLGSNEHRTASCRFVLAFNEPLETLLAGKKLIRDLPERFQIHISIPPLNDRKEDIPALVKHFEKLWFECHPKSTTLAESIKLEDEDIAGWKNRDWADAASNVRGLRNAVENELDCRMLRVELANDPPPHQLSRPATLEGEKPKRNPGRPKGIKTLRDDSFVEFLDKAVRFKWSIALLTSQLSTKKIRLAVTPEAFRQRVNRITTDSQLKAKAKGLYKTLALRYGWITGKPGSSPS